MSLLLLMVSALHILILILLFVATLDKVSLLGTLAAAAAAAGPPALLQTPATPLFQRHSTPPLFPKLLPWLPAPRPFP